MAAINRRTALTVVAAAPAAVAMAAPAQSGQDIYALIEAHKAAMQRFDAIIDLHEEAEDRFRKDWDANPVMVPMAILPNGQHVSPWCDIRLNDRDQLLSGINRYYEEGCAGIRWVRAVSPERADELEAVLKGMKRRAVAYIKKAEAMLAEREDQAGLTEANELYHAASEAEVEARADLVAYRPRTEAEAKAKAEYLKGCAALHEEWGQGFVESLVQRLSVV